MLKISPKIRLHAAVWEKRDEVENFEFPAARHRERIANKLINERMGLAARQHMRNLRHAAFVDIRL